MCEFYYSVHSKYIKDTNGGMYRTRETGCGEGMAIFDADDNYLTTIPKFEYDTNEVWAYYYTNDEILEMACASITAIKATQWLKNNKERLEQLKKDVAIKMKEKNLEGAVLQ